MQKCSTRYHGEIEYSESQVVNFEGLFGFEEETRFLLLELPAMRPLVFLQSVADPGLCFLALPAGVVEKDYQLDLAPEDLERLRLPRECKPRIGQEVMCLVLLTVQEGKPTTANLMAPLIFNMQARIAIQIISANSRYSHQHLFLEHLEESVC